MNFFVKYYSLGEVLTMYLRTNFSKLGIVVFSNN